MQRQKGGRWAALWWLAAALIMAGLLGLSIQPGLAGGGLAHPLDKLAHFVVYAALAFCLTRATGVPYLGLLWAAWFGVADELLQAFVPARESSFLDWLADLAGAAVGSTVAGRTMGGRRVATPATAPAPSRRWGRN